MLHIVTPLYRPKLLKYVYDSIPNHSDITWHISMSTKIDSPDDEFLIKDKRIKLYKVDCEDSDTVSKRNIIFQNINDGYFHLLDDDTEFHENMYLTYRKFYKINFMGMIIGIQVNYKNNVRLRPSFPPKFGAIDSGNVLCHSIVLKNILWEKNPKNPFYPNDLHFWDRVYKHFGKCEVVRTPISKYNSLRNKLL